MGKSVPIGLSNVVYAICVSDVAPSTIGGKDGYATYDDPKKLLGAISANFAPNASNDTLFADDGPYETASTLGAMSLELNVADIPVDQKAELLGATYDDSTGVLYHSAEDIPPYVAIGMSVKKSNGADRLIWYLKGKFTAPDDNNQTKADSINWNTPTISGNFLKRDADGLWKVTADTDDANVSSTVKENWFSSPNVGTMDRVAAPAFSPASGTLSLATTSAISITSSTSDASFEYKLSTENVWKAVPSGGISTDDFSADTNIVINARATKAGMISSASNAAYKITA